MRVRWRIAISAVAGLMAVVAQAMLTPDWAKDAVVGWILEVSGAGVTATPANLVKFEVCARVYFSLAGIVVAVIAFALLSGRRRITGETHCRACGYILRGLTEPRCPECGERI